ncbi:phosphatase PAP2 family protein [Hymenobacter sp. 15J16-1T3B]|uniref:phosphatase PAP2 family protein n=1 Tax=Hymenobacter sp. 15J16-1T3B TaxID=2886941 RepID=UPI001D106292|nr:phosphatase PAP2 family protein [Hymenobacter sp. 15J16-1T3B]MCC3160171.1 phosphatase PAP2 family protein [Hymenobacter sp. 15J16-1T3B]
MKQRLFVFYQKARTALRGHGALVALLLLGIGAPWFIFVEVAEDIWESGGFIGDQAILEWIHQLESPGLDQVALTLTTAGGPEVMSVVGVAIAGLLLWRHRRTEALFFALSVGGAVALNVLAKTIFGRPRPALWESIAPAKFYSFPSGHAMGSAALAAALGFLLWRTRGRWVVWIGGALFALGVGLSRMYLGVHYPSDVLAGWVCSVGWVVSLHVLFSPDFRQLRTWWLASRAYWRRPA